MEPSREIFIRGAQRSMRITTRRERPGTECFVPPRAADARGYRLVAGSPTTTTTTATVDDSENHDGHQGGQRGSDPKGSA